MTNEEVSHGMFQQMVYAEHKVLAQANALSSEETVRHFVGEFS